MTAGSYGRWLRRCMLCPQIVWPVVLLVVLGLVHPRSVEAVELVPWPEVTPEELRDTAPAIAESAPAVILRREGRLRLSPVRGGQAYLEVFQRTKILTAEGTSYGTVVLPSSALWRIEDVEARTVLPDGRTIELNAEAIFRTAPARSWSDGEVAFALSAVMVGAVVDYRYRLYLESLYFVPPWYLKNELPVVETTYRCDVPRLYTVREHVTAPPSAPVERTESSIDGVRSLVFRAVDLPAVPREPAMPSFEEMAGTVRVLPVELRLLVPRPVLSSWRDVVDHVRGRRGGYGRFARSSSQLRRRAESLTAGIESRREKAETLYLWVRDTVAMFGSGGIGLSGLDADQLLERGRANPAEQALILELMLKTADVPASVVWARRRHHGTVMPEIVDPTQFDTVLTVVDFEDGPVVLDPSDQRLPFAALPPDLEGVRCLLLDRGVARRQPQPWITTPVSAAEESTRSARLRLRVGAEGSLQGEGELTLTGHYAWRWLRTADQGRARAAAGRRWLQRSSPEMVVVLRSVREDVDALQVVLEWTMELVPALIDDRSVSVPVVGPLALTDIVFTERPEERVSPVVLDFAFLERVDVVLEWDQRWRLDAVPVARESLLPPGSLTAKVVVDPEHNVVHVQRRLAVDQLRLPLTQYGELRRLYRQAASFDDERIYLSRSGQ